jgi:hypothetical protein
MKKYINPVCKVMTLSLKQSLLDEKFGNTSYVPVSNIDGDNEEDIHVNDMFSNKSVWD